MAVYETKPFRVEARQWFPGKSVPGVFKPDPQAEVDAAGAPPRPFVVTVHDQRSYLDDGDWVITEEDGIHHYPCKPDVFEKKYRLVR